MLTWVEQNLFIEYIFVKYLWVVWNLWSLELPFSPHYARFSIFNISSSSAERLSEVLPRSERVIILKIICMHCDADLSTF